MRLEGLRVSMHIAVLCYWAGEMVCNCLFRECRGVGESRKDEREVNYDCKACASFWLAARSRSLDIACDRFGVRARLVTRHFLVGRVFSR